MSQRLAREEMKGLFGPFFKLRPLWRPRNMDQNLSSLWPFWMSDWRQEFCITALIYYPTTTTTMKRSATMTKGDVFSPEQTEEMCLCWWKVLLISPLSLAVNCVILNSLIISLHKFRSSWPTDFSSVVHILPFVSKLWLSFPLFLALF